MQKPHCTAPLSRNAAWSGESTPPSARPSTVRISEPSASTARTRQESTVRPSTITVQAPHSPTRQHSLAPVRAEVVAQDVEQRVVRGHADRATVPIDGDLDGDVRDHAGSPIARRSRAVASARRPSTRSIASRYSGPARMERTDGLASANMASKIAARASADEAGSARAPVVVHPEQRPRPDAPVRDPRGARGVHAAGHGDGREVVAAAARPTLVGAGDPVGGHRNLDRRDQLAAEQRRDARAHEQVVHRDPSRPARPAPRPPARRARAAPGPCPRRATRCTRSRPAWPGSGSGPSPPLRRPRPAPERAAARAGRRPRRS